MSSARASFTLEPACSLAIAGTNPPTGQHQYQNTGFLIGLVRETNLGLLPIKNIKGCLLWLHLCSFPPIFFYGDFCGIGAAPHPIAVEVVNFD